MHAPVRSRQRTLTVLTTLGLAAGLTACGSSSGGGPAGGPAGGTALPTASVTGGSVVDVNAAPSGTISVALPADSPEDIDLRKKQAAAFEKKYPGTKVDIVSVPEDGYDEKVLTSIAGGNPQDVFATGDKILPTLVEKNYALDLKPLLTAQGVDVADLYPDVLDGLTYQGKMVGLTDNWDTQVLYYNRALFRAAGLPFPTGDWTWADYDAAAAKLTTGSGRDKTYGSLIGKWWVPVYDQVAAAGGSVFAEDGSRCTLTDPKSIAGLQHLDDLRKAGVDPGDTEDGAMGRESEEVFEAGKAAMLITAGRYQAATFAETEGLDWAVAPLPKGPAGRSNFFHLAALSIPANSKNPNTAWQYVRFVTSPEGMRLGLPTFAGIPALRSLTNDPAFAQSPLVTEHDTLQPFVDSLPTARRAPAIVDFTEFRDKVETALKPLWKGQTDPATAAANACKAVDADLASR